MNKKQTITNDQAEKFLKEWKQGKGNLNVDIKEDSIMYKKEVIVNKPTWTKEQKEDLQRMFKEHGDEQKTYTDKKFDDLKNEMNANFDKLFQLLENHIKQDHE